VIQKSVLIFNLFHQRKLAHKNARNLAKERARSYTTRAASDVIVVTSDVI